MVKNQLLFSVVQGTVRGVEISVFFLIGPTPNF